MAEAVEASRFGAESTALEVVEGLNLEGKTVLITGTSDGIGVETARAFLTIGATVVGAVRNLAKMGPVAEELKTSTGNAKFEAIECDLASLASVRACAAAFREKYTQLDILILNAGVMATAERRETQDGFEFQFGVNHLGHFLLSALLTDLMLDIEGGSRLVSLSSTAHKRGGINFDDLMFTADPYDKWKCYGQSKTANILFAREFNRRYSSRGAVGVSAHPGAIRTSLGRELTDTDREMFVKMADMIKWKTIPQGASNSTFAATTNLAPEEGGSYFVDCHRVTEVYDGGAEGRFADNIGPAAASEEHDQRLWTVSEELVQQTFPAVSS